MIHQRIRTGRHIAQYRVIHRILSHLRTLEAERKTAMSESIAADELRLLIERIERLEEEKKAIADDIKEVYAEAKSRGYDTKTMRECVKLRKLETHVRREREALLDTYKAALGLDYSETPLGSAAVQRAAQKLHDTVTAGGGTMTVEIPGHEPVTIGGTAH